MDVIQQIVAWVGQQPILAWLGALIVIALLFAPFVLSLAGLSGQQIIDLLALTMRFVIDLVSAFRAQNKGDGESSK